MHFQSIFRDRKANNLSRQQIQKKLLGIPKLVTLVMQTLGIVNMESRLGTYNVTQQQRHS